MVAAGLVVSLMTGSDGASATDWDKRPPVADRCYEDEPCFDCRFMGNRICGPSPKALRNLPRGGWR